MSSSESGLSDDHDPMAVVSDDEVVPELEVFTSDTESEPEMIVDDEDDFQPFALPDFGDDAPITDGIPIDDVFTFPAPIQDHLIIDHTYGEHIVAPILDVVPLVVIPLEDWPFDDLFNDDVDLFLGDHPVDAQGDAEVDDVVVLDKPPPAIPVIDISSDSSLHSVADSFESVTSSALQAAGLQLYASDLDDDDAMSATTSSPVQVHTPPHIPDHIPGPDPVPFSIPDVAPLIPEPISAPLDLPPVDPYVPQPPPVDIVPPPSFVSDEHRTDLSIVFYRISQLPVQRKAPRDSP
ncbi:hypothetical protein Hdeb2414_s0013g00410181 [Helianthus debilis subsp. tardiflorus]